MNAQGYDARIGKPYRDAEGRVGILTDVLRGTAYLRPEHGGREWTVPVEDVEPVTQLSGETGDLSVKLAAVNKRSRGEL